MTIEEKLREMILEEYGTVVAFAKQSGLPSSTVYSILTRGINNSSAQNVLRICQALSIDADELAKGRALKIEESKSAELSEWLSEEKLRIMNCDITIKGKPLTEAQRLALWDSLRMSADFIRRNT